MFVEAPHPFQPVAMRQAFGVQGGGDIGGDAADADRRPNAQQPDGLAP